MGLMVDGEWHDAWYDTSSTGGRFERPETRFRNRIGVDPAFPAEAGRYHLYVSYACPWAHRALIYRKLKGLEDTITVSVVDPLMRGDGWVLGEDADPVNHARFLWQIYRQADRNYNGRVTVPVLWDKIGKTIVNNESSEIIRMFDTGFGPLARGPVFCPEYRRAEIDALNAEIYANINNGVYRAGFATTQAAYDEAFDRLFATLDSLEDRLRQTPFLLGDEVTEADWRLFTTLVRFDAVYHGHFKCNRQRLIDFPELWDFTRTLFQIDGIAATVHFDHIKRHYYGSHQTINPSGIVPKGPAIDFLAPTRRPVPNIAGIQ
ncbi:glutathione S-transferase family protein [Telmatospirillum sp.]|uniref:glutathione S-transferase family protein n=1 Tax=Telmatospirillum sp. TaxID=2079197 RepID=UPI0028477358|nr:glutathione S-transferase family protein [Telmatospirillum sp.]MDR3440102.1 glutathione S-transferase family protein [Telmatospirillum sp.]